MDQKISIIHGMLQEITKKLANLEQPADVTDDCESTAAKKCRKCYQSRQTPIKSAEIEPWKETYRWDKHPEWMEHIENF